MKCPACGAEGPEGIGFCGACGEAFKRLCRECGAENPADFNFCGRCGVKLAHAEPGTDADRRLLTVMFCDLVESTALAEKLDPEDLRKVLRLYQEASAKVIEPFEGYVAQYLGDGLLIYFGYPQAHEDDARRAVYSGLGICEAVRELDRRLKRDMGIRLAVRVGIHTGPVVAGVVGSAERGERLAMGQTPNIAARLQSLAEPNTVVLSAATQRLVQSFFACRPLGSQVLRGASASMEVFRALNERERYATENAGNREEQPFVGRDDELAAIFERLERARHGHGQVVLLAGEAGIGKSRLAGRFFEQAGADVHRLRTCHCSPYARNSALHPIVELLRRLCGLRREDTAEQKMDRVERFLEPYGFSSREAVPLLANLLSVPLEGRYPVLDWSPQRQKEKTFEILLSLLVKPAEPGVAFLHFEDAHWMDPSTLELVGQLVDEAPGHPVLLVLSYRPSFEPSWEERDHLARIELRRLSDEQVKRIVEGLTSGRSLPPSVVNQVVKKTDGVPLFVEELTKVVVESDLGWENGGSHSGEELFGDLPIPNTLVGLLTARLDRLFEIKQVAQQASVVGREFTLEMMEAVSLMDSASLKRHLNRLVDAELFFVQGVEPHTRYVFKHALIQDAAYDSLLKSTRVQYHRRLAEALVEKFPETVQASPELVAHHFTEAKCPEPAVDYWLRAGKLAGERSANLEAIEHLHHGLRLLETLPDCVDRCRKELALLGVLGPALIANRGYAAPEVEHLYRRRLALAERIGDQAELIPTLVGLATYYQSRAEFAPALELCGELMRLAKDAPPALLLEACFLMGSTLLFRGRLAEARDYLEEGYSCYLKMRGERSLSGTGQYTGIVILYYMALAMWQLGHLDRSRDRFSEAMDLAAELPHAFTRAGGLVFGSWLHQLRGEIEITQQQAREAIAMASEHGFPFWQAWGSMVYGWTLIEEGREEEGTGEMGRGLAIFRATEMKVLQTYFLAILAEAHGKAGQIDEGREFLEEALAAAGEEGERIWEAELWRIQGEFALAASPQDPADAEACFRRSLEVAREQGARSFELRTAVRLARLWREEGKPSEARELLAESYGRLEGGSETADLREARALLSTLSP